MLKHLMTGGQTTRLIAAAHRGSDVIDFNDTLYSSFALRSVWSAFVVGTCHSDLHWFLTTHI